MPITENAKQYHEKMFPEYISKFLETDPEFIERFGNFTFDEVVNSDDLDGHTRFMVILASLLGCQGIDEFKAVLPAALNFGVTPVEAKEIVYQSVAYLGIGRVLPFLKATNESAGGARHTASVGGTIDHHCRKPFGSWHSSTGRHIWRKYERLLEIRSRGKLPYQPAGWRTTALAIIIPVTGLIISSVK